MPMKIEILKEKENKPLARKEIEFRVDHVGATTPRRADIRAKISAQYNADAAAVVIKKLVTKYGIGKTEGSARVYATPEQMSRIELNYIIKRHEPRKKKESEE
jgi:small subunit ribosomal protein S24e